MENHEHPKGAITSEAEYLSFVGKGLWHVYGLGSASSIEFYDINGKINNVDLSCGVSRFGWKKADYLKSGEVDFSLADCNIDGHHNHHYLFGNKVDAEAYCEYAKENTPEILNDNSFCDWDYDDHDWGAEYQDEYY